MPRKLKVYRMPIGFEDAYVAAPSRKAALAAWGAQHDQFARGLAEEVTDPKLAGEALARPGEVIRKSRGDLASQLRALAPWPKGAGKAPPQPDTQAKRKPAPPRGKLDAAEAALTGARARHQAEVRKLEAQLQALREEQEAELARLSRQRDQARDAYNKALEAWSGG